MAVDRPPSEVDTYPSWSSVDTRPQNANRNAPRPPACSQRQQARYHSPTAAARSGPNASGTRSAVAETGKPDDWPPSTADTPIFF